jgi:hypothetical protein
MMLAMGTGRTLAWKVPEVLEEVHFEMLGRGFGDGHGDAEDGVGAELAFVLGAVEFDHGAVDIHLIQGGQTDDRIGDDGVDVFDGLENAFAQVTVFVSVTKLDSFVDAGGGAGRERRPGRKSRRPA